MEETQSNIELMRHASICPVSSMKEGTEKKTEIIMNSDEISWEKYIHIGYRLELLTLKARYE